MNNSLYLTLSLYLLLLDKKQTYKIFMFSLPKIRNMCVQCVVVVRGTIEMHHTNKQQMYEKQIEETTSDKMLGYTTNKW